MEMVMNHAAMGGERFEDATEARGGEDVGTGEPGETSEDQLAMGGRGTGGAIRDRPVKVIPCPRCQSMNTKFCYYNNYSLTQPRHFCRNCQRYWTVGGTLRNVPVGGGSRKKTRTRSRSDPYHVAASSYDAQSAPPLLIASSCMQQLSMLPPPALGFASGPFPSTTSSSRLPFLHSALESLTPRKPLHGLQEVPDLQSIYVDSGHVTPMATPPLLTSFFPPQPFPSQQTEPFVSAMAKAGVWSSAAPMQTPCEVPSFTKPLHPLGGYGHRTAQQLPAHGVVSENLKAAFWDTPATQTRLMMDDRLVPHASWEESDPSTAHNTPNLSPNGSSTTDHSLPPPSSFSHPFCDDVSQPWVGLHAAGILNF